MNKLVFDVGGTFIKYGILSNNADIIEKNKVETPKDPTKENMFAVLKEIIDTYAGKVDGIAFSLPGMLDSESGHMYSGGKISGFYDIDFYDLMKKYTDLPVCIENDGKCAALAELGFGGAKDKKSAVIVALGTGIAGGIIIDGELYRGFHGAAGEFSFINTKATNNIHDWWAMYNSVPNFVKECERALDQEEGSMSGEDVFTYIDSKDERILSIYENFLNILGAQLINLRAILDPELFLIGGGISNQPRLLNDLREAIDRMQNPMFKLEIHVEICKYKNDANLVGALYRFQQIRGK